MFICVFSGHWRLFYFLTIWILSVTRFKKPPVVNPSVHRVVNVSWSRLDVINTFLRLTLIYVNANVSVSVCLLWTGCTSGFRALKSSWNVTLRSVCFAVNLRFSWKRTQVLNVSGCFLSSPFWSSLVVLCHCWFFLSLVGVFLSLPSHTLFDIIEGVFYWRSVS